MEPTISPITNNELARLPLYLRGNYVLYNGSIVDQNIIWAKVKSDGNYTPDQNLNDNHFRIGGDTALSTYTMLSETNRKTFVIGKDEFRFMKTLGALKSLNKKYGDNRIEVWLYNPVTLSENKNVDKLSLYLSLKHDEDERVKGALEDIINEIQW